MSYYAAPFTFDFTTSKINVDSGAVDVECIGLYTAIKLAQASEEGITYEKIAQGSGLSELGPGVQVGITVELLGNWQLKFPAGNYVARVGGGNLIGGPSSDPIAYSAGVQTLLIQSAASTVVNSTSLSPWDELIETGLTAKEIMRINLAAVAGKTEITKAGNNATIKFKSQDGLIDRISAEMTESERTTITLDGGE